jgi:hypothetical protein
MKKFAFKLLLFLAIFLILDKLFIIVANLSADAEVDKRLEYLVKGDINKDIVILGSSRGSRDIIAENIENETGYSTYNLCYPGADLEFQEFILKTLLKFNKLPKILVLDVADSIEFKIDAPMEFRSDRLYPLVRYPWIRQELINQGKMDKFFSKFLILSRLNIANFDLRKKVFTPLDTLMNCGSMPVSWQRQGMNWDYLAVERQYSTKDEINKYIRAYKEINKICSLNKITLVAVFPPLYRIHRKSFENRIRQFSEANVLFYIYNTDNPIYRNKDYFYDRGHLKKNGAIVYTDELAVYLKDLIKRNSISFNKP